MDFGIKLKTYLSLYIQELTWICCLWVRADVQVVWSGLGVSPVVEEKEKSRS